MRWWSTVGVGLVAGACFATTLPPTQWWPLSIVGAALLVAHAVRSTPWSAIGAGWLAGLVVFSAGLGFTAQFNAIGAMVLIALEALAVAIPCFVASRSSSPALAFTASAVLIEWVRQHAPFGGLPIGSPILGQVEGPFALVAHLLGPLGVLVVPLALGASVGEHLGRKDPGVAHPRVLAPVGIAVAVLTLALVVPAGGARAGRLSVSCLQGGGPRGFTALQVSPVTSASRYLALLDHLQPLRPRRPWLIVLPEDAIQTAASYRIDPAVLAIRNQAVRLGATIEVGVRSPGPGQSFFNRAIVLGSDGTVVGTYEKVHRVPFGEYVPMRGLLAHLVHLDAVPLDAVPGRRPGVVGSPVGSLGITLSFETFFADRGRAAVRAGASILLAPTNTASYRSSSVTDQELAAARLQALDLHRSVVLCATVGRSALLGPTGATEVASPLGPPAVLTAVLPLEEGDTPYVVAGDLPVLLAMVVVLFTTVLVRRQS